MDPGKGPCWAPRYRLIAAAIRTINNPLAILLTREVGGRKRSSRPASDAQQARGGGSASQPASQAPPGLPRTPGGLRPEGSLAPNCFLIWAPALSREGSGLPQAGWQPQEEGLGEEGEGAREAHGPPPPNPCLVRGSPAHLSLAWAGCPGLPGSRGVQGRNSVLPGAHTPHSPPRPHPGA